MLAPCFGIEVQALACSSKLGASGDRSSDHRVYRGSALHRRCMKMEACCLSLFPTHVQQVASVLSFADCAAENRPRCSGDSRSQLSRSAVWQRPIRNFSGGTAFNQRTSTLSPVLTDTTRSLARAEVARRALMLAAMDGITATQPRRCHCSATTRGRGKHAAEMAQAVSITPTLFVSQRLTSHACKITGACNKGYYCAWEEFNGEAWCCEDVSSEPPTLEPHTP